MQACNHAVSKQASQGSSSHGPQQTAYKSGGKASNPYW
jgi:hypothetical protein